MKRVLFVMLALFVLAAALPVFAQDDEAIQVVSDAVNNLMEQDSYTTRVEQVITQIMEMGSGQQVITTTTDTTQTIDMQVVKTEDGYNVSGVIDQQITTGSGEFSQDLGIKLEIVLLDGTAYLRGSDIAPMLQNTIPDVWTEIDEDVTAANPTLAGFGPDALEQFYGITATFDSDSVNSIEELESTEIDGQTVRVFEVDYNLDALLSSGMLDRVTASIGGGAGLMSAEDVEKMVQDMFEGAQATYTVYVGADDGLLYQLDSVMVVDTTLSIQGMTLPMQMQIDSSTSFSGFNEPVEIEAPEVGE